MKSIDVFCHILPPEYYEAAVKDTSAQYHMFTRALNLKAMSDVETRLEVMKKFPGYQQLPCLVSPPVEYFAGPDKSPAIAELGNDAMCRIVKEHPDMFPGFIAGIPFNNVKASVEEIKRSKDMGAKGIQIFTHMNGEPIDTEKYWPIYEICEKLNMPILLHPAGGLKTPEFPSETISQYELWWTIGWPYQTTVAMSRLVFAGIFEDFPDIKIVTHHVGGMIPMLAGRLENGLKMYGSRTAESLKDKLTKTKLKGEPVDSFKKFYADAASFGSAAAIRCGLDFFGKDHILFASDMPFDPEQGPGYIDRTLKAIDSLSITEDDKFDICYNNAARLFHL